jgi:Flp pilus assembly protein TadD
LLGEEHPDTLTSMGNLAITYWAQGRTAEAAALQEEVLEKQKRLLGEEHPDTLKSMGNLAITYRAQGRTTEAATLQEDTRIRLEMV